MKQGAVRTSNRYAVTSAGRTYDDAFDQPKRPNLKGVFEVAALVEFYELATLPADFIKQHPGTRAEELLSTTTTPPFWVDAGTPHNLTVIWACTDPKKGTRTRMATQVRG